MHTTVECCLQLVNNRKFLNLYSEAAARLRTNPVSVLPDALKKTAGLFRAFGEDYHGRKLEEAFIFPAVKKAEGDAAGYIDVLIDQHNKGREKLNEPTETSSKSGILNFQGLAKQTFELPGV